MPNRWIRIISIILTIFSGILIMGYTSYRAYKIPITHDEAQSFKLMNERTYKEIKNYSIPEDHMLNTLADKVLSNNFGTNEWILRLPNLIGNMIYLLFTFLILWHFGKRELIFPAFLLLNVNPYLFDFFSCARGYGLSTALMIPSIYYILVYYREFKPSKLALSLLFAILAVLSLVTLLNYYLILVSLTVLMLAVAYLYKSKNRKSVVLYITGILILLVSSYFLYYYLHTAIARLSGKTFVKHNLFFNFYEGTIRTISFRSIYTKDDGNLVTLISYTIIGTYIISFIYLIFKAINEKSKVFFNTSMSFFIIGVAMALSVTFQHEIFHIKFPSDRAALFFIPIFMFMIIFILFEFYESKYLKIPSTVLFFILAGLLIFNGIKHSNASYYVDWDYDMVGREMIQDLESNLTREDKNKTITLGTFWIFEPSANYYRVAKKLSWLNEVSRDSLKEKQFDFYYLRPIDTVNMHFKNSDILKVYPQVGTLLLRRQ
jgi:hypothetical protein